MITNVIFFIWWLFHFLPFSTVKHIGISFGKLLYKVDKEQYAIAAINIRKCFPKLNIGEQEQLLNKYFQVYGRSLTECAFTWWSSATRLNKLIRVEGLEHIKNTNTIIMHPHFVGADIGYSWVTRHFNITACYEEDVNTKINTFMLQKRKRFGKPQIFPKHMGLRPLIKNIQVGRMLFYPPDLDASGNTSIFVPFFGISTSTLTTVSRLARKTSSIVVPCSTRILDNNEGYLIKFYPPWENYPSEDIISDTLRMNMCIEQMILEMPEQYLWSSERFKTRPAGEPAFY